MNDIINIIPEKYRGTALLLAAVLPWLTRGLYALMNGRGIRGTLSAIWFGTNQPQEKTSAPSASGVTSAGKALVVLAFASLVFTGCVALDTGARAVVVRAEQSITIANSTFDSAVHIDDANRSFFRTNCPPFHAFCEWLRVPVIIAPLTNSQPRGLAIIRAADAVKETYKSTGSTNDYALLIQALATVETATAQAQQLIVTANQK